MPASPTSRPTTFGAGFVNESALTTRIKSLRPAVGDDRTRQRVIRTVHGKGYEFVAEVRVIENPNASAGGGRRSPSPSALPSAVQSRIGREALLSELVRRTITIS